MREMRGNGEVRNSVGDRGQEAKPGEGVGHTGTPGLPGRGRAGRTRPRLPGRHAHCSQPSQLRICQRSLGFFLFPKTALLDTNFEVFYPWARSHGRPEENLSWGFWESSLWSRAGLFSGGDFQRGEG